MGVRVIAVALALLLMLAAAGATGVVLLGDDQDGADDRGWAAEVLPFVEFVEKERGLEFERPIEVELLAEDDFRREVTAERSELTDEEREDIEQTTGVLQAVGLLDSDVDLFESVNDLMGAGVVGFYSDDDQRIRLRGATLTPASEVTLVHELTHALQDQHFDIGARGDELEESERSAEAAAFRALVEGDASRVETAYRQSLSTEERSELAKEESEQGDAYREDARDVPKIMATMLAAPYALGEAMLGLAVTMDGNERVDELFRDPPTTDEHLYDPWTLLQDGDRAAEVDEPELVAGEERFDAGPFGALMWYLVLAERVPAIRAMDATDGWAGDSFVAFTREDETCVRASFRGDNARDGRQMRSALRSWIAGSPGSWAAVAGEGANAEFESCASDTSADVGTDSSDTALQLALARTLVATGALAGSGDEDLARCYADHVVHRFTPEQLTDPSFGGNDDFDREVVRILRACS